MALPHVPEPAQEEQRPRRFAIGGQAVAEAHGTRWFQASRIDPPLNGFVPFRLWSIRNNMGDVLVPGANTAAISDITPLDFFLLMFPPKQFIDMVELTNTELTKLELNKTNCSEMLKFFGAILLMTKFEFTSRASLWSSVAPSKYQPAPHFGLTGMSKLRFMTCSGQ